MLFTYQKKTGKLITSQTTHLPAVKQNDYVQIDVNYNNAKNNNTFSTNIFSRVAKTSNNCDSCDH
jgi:hypothetical protein